MKRTYAEFMAYAYRGERKSGEALADMLMSVWRDLTGLAAKIAAARAKSAGTHKYKRSMRPVFPRLASRH